MYLLSARRLQLLRHVASPPSRCRHHSPARFDSLLIFFFIALLPLPLYCSSPVPSCDSIASSFVSGPHPASSLPALIACASQNHPASAFYLGMHYSRQGITSSCASHVTRHTSHVTRHTSHVTRHTSHVTRHTSHVTRHTSDVIRHTSHVTRHTSYVTRHTSHITRHTSDVIRHTSYVTRHTSCTPCRHPCAGNNDAAASAFLTCYSSDGGRYPTPQHANHNRLRLSFISAACLTNYLNTASLRDATALHTIILAASSSPPLLPPSHLQENIRARLVPPPLRPLF
jgi:hypothetical protein